VLFTAAAGLAAIAAFALADVAGWPALLPRFAHADTLWLAVCFGGQVLAYLGYVLAVRDMARVDDGPSLSFSLTTRTVVAGFGVYAATHAAGGFAVDYWALRRAGLNRQEATARVLGLGALEYAVLAPAALISAVVLLLGGAPHVQDAMTLPWLLAVPGFIAALWISSPRRSARFADPGDGGRARAAFAHAVAGVAKLRSLMTSPRRHGAGVIGVSLYWFGDIACLWAALQMFDAKVSTPALILAYATGYVITRRSLPAGGAGIVEVLMTFALVWVGLPLAPALLGVCVYRLFNFWLPIVPALAVLPTVKQLRRDYSRAEEELDEASAA
jgi:uncharacterized membrane protein YbhN (UPF0104 family)